MYAHPSPPTTPEETLLWNIHALPEAHTLSLTHTYTHKREFELCSTISLGEMDTVGARICRFPLIRNASPAAFRAHSLFFRCSLYPRLRGPPPSILRAGLIPGARGQTGNVAGAAARDWNIAGPKDWTNFHIFLFRGEGVSYWLRQRVVSGEGKRMMAPERMGPRWFPWDEIGWERAAMTWSLISKLPSFTSVQVCKVDFQSRSLLGNTISIGLLLKHKYNEVIDDSGISWMSSIYRPAIKCQTVVEEQFVGTTSSLLTNAG